MRTLTPTFIAVQVITVEEFKTLVLDHLVHSFKDRDTREVCEALVDSGLLKFDPQNIGEFMKALCGHVFLPTVAVDIQDSMFHWLVSGSSAIFIDKAPGQVVPKL